MDGVGRLSGVALECRDPAALATFYSRLTGWPVVYSDPDWYSIGEDRDATFHLSFQRSPGHQPPTWPDPASSMQFHLHLRVDDLNAAERTVLALGGTRLAQRGRGTVGNVAVVGQDALRASVTVRAPAERAFAAFTEGLSDWWIREFTWSGPAALAAIGMEPRVGGACYEIGPHGFRCDWGRVLAWDPPDRVVFTWQIDPSRAPQPDPAKASEVEVRFQADGPSTRVDLEHRHFARHGHTQHDRYRTAMIDGWTQLLARYRRAVSG